MFNGVVDPPSLRYRYVLVREASDCSRFLVPLY